MWSVSIVFEWGHLRESGERAAIAQFKAILESIIHFLRPLVQWGFLRINHDFGSFLSGKGGGKSVISLRKSD